MLRNPQEEHSEIQQLHLSHRVIDSAPLGTTSRGGQHQHQSFGQWVATGEDAEFYIHSDRMRFPAFFPFCAFLYVDLVHFDLTCAAT